MGSVPHRGASVTSVSPRGTLQPGISRLWQLHGFALKSPTGKGPEAKRGPRELVSIKGSPRPSSRAVHQNEQGSQAKRPGDLHG